MSAAAKRTALAAASIVALLTVCVVGPAEGRNSTPRDQVPPTAPADVHVVKATPVAVYVAWQPAQDDVEVAGYFVYGDMGKKTVSNPSYIVSGLGCGESSALSVSAFDRSGNRSPKTTALIATAACADTQPPSTPSNFRQLVTTQTAVVLAWSPSTDNVGVVGYGVFRGTAKVADVSEPTVALSGLACGSTYSYLVDAVDAAGNRSLLGNAYAATSACGDSTPPSAPSALAQTGKTATSISLGWTAANDDVGVAGYRVTVGGAPRMSVTQTSATLTGLDCDGSYAIGVDAYDAAGNRSAAANLAATTGTCPSQPPTPPAPPAPDTTPPSVPGALAVSAVTQTSMNLQWTASTDDVGVTAYDVYRNSSKVASVTSTSSSQSGLVCGTTYQYEVVARDAAGNASQPARASAATAACATPQTPPPPPPPSPPADTTPPSQPTGLTVSGATRTSLSLTWTPSSDDVAVTGYRTLVNGTPNGTSAQPGTTVSGLTCGTAYTVEVEAYDAAGNHSTRASVVASTSACADTQPPSAPTNVVTTNRTSTSIALSWNSSSDNVGVSGYGLYRGGTSAGTSSTTNAVFAGLACNTNYTLAVDAYDAAGNRSSQTAVMVSTTACADTAPPTAPTGLAASSVTQTGLSLSWNASSDNTGVTGYDVYRNATKMTTVTSTSAAQSGLACGTTYTFGVVARDAAGNSSPQASIQVQTSACAAPAPAPTPPPPPSGSPIPSTGVISAGGVYTGAFGGQVTISTTDAVTLSGCSLTYTGGTIIKTSASKPPNLTIDHCTISGGSGRIIDADAFSRIVLKNNTIEKTAGVTLVGNGDVIFLRNRHHNIQRAPGSVGNFLQVRLWTTGTFEVAWNEIINEYNQSDPEDVFSIYHSSNTWWHDNYIQGHFQPGNGPGSSQNTITLDGYGGSGQPVSNNRIEGNILVRTLSIAVFPTSTGPASGNVFLNNHVVNAGYLDDGVTRNYYGYQGMSVKPGGTNNQAHGNVLGAMNGTNWGSGRGNDGNFDGEPRGNGDGVATGAWTDNNRLKYGQTITRADENAETQRWRDKVAAAGISLGA